MIKNISLSLSSAAIFLWSTIKLHHFNILRFIFTRTSYYKDLIQAISDIAFNNMFLWFSRSFNKSILCRLVWINQSIIRLNIINKNKWRILMLIHSLLSNTIPKKYSSCIKKLVHSIAISTPQNKLSKIIKSNILHCYEV